MWLPRRLVLMLARALGIRPRLGPDVRPGLAIAAIEAMLATEAPGRSLDGGGRPAGMWSEPEWLLRRATLAQCAAIAPDVVAHCRLVRKAYELERELQCERLMAMRQQRRPQVGALVRELEDLTRQARRIERSPGYASQLMALCERLSMAARDDPGFRAWLGRLR